MEKVARGAADSLKTTETWTVSVSCGRKWWWSAETAQFILEWVTQFKSLEFSLLGTAGMKLVPLVLPSHTEVCLCTCMCMCRWTTLFLCQHHEDLWALFRSGHAHSGVHWPRVKRKWPRCLSSQSQKLQKRFKNWNKTFVLQEFDFLFLQN